MVNPTVATATIPPVRVHVPEEDIARITDQVADVLRSGMLSGGPHAAAFEREFAAAFGVEHAVAVSNGTAAIEVIFRALEVDGKHVLVPTNTFVATATAIIHGHNHPRLVDIDPLTGSPTLEMLVSARTRRTRAVVLVHIGGIITPDLERIREWCRREDLLLVEDAAHAHGSALDGEAAGTLGRAAAFSLFATKVMTSGEGGMVTTADAELARRVRVLRDHGKTDPSLNLHHEFGSNWRMSELHAILGRTQLARLPEFLEARARVAACYDDALRALPEVTVLRNGGPSSFYKYLVLLPSGVDKDRVRGLMRERGVRVSGDVYDVPLHRQPLFAGLVRRPFPGAEEFAARHLALPVNVLMTQADVERAAAALGEALRESAS